MKISNDGKRVSFKTEPEELFLAEKSGAKSNTVRILDLEEWRLLKRYDPKKIIIQYQQEIFLRTLTNIHFGGMILGKVIAIFSWRLQPTPSETDDAFTAVTISRNLLGLLQSIAHGRSMNMVIRELYEASQYKRYEEEGDQFA